MLRRIVPVAGGLLLGGMIGYGVGWHRADAAIRECDGRLAQLKSVRRQAEDENNRLLRAIWELQKQIPPGTDGR
jgi:hypothetical protein